MRWLLILVFLATLGVACGSSSDSDSESNSEVNMADEETTTTASGLQTVSYTHLRAHET